MKAADEAQEALDTEIARAAQRADDQPPYSGVGATLDLARRGLPRWRRRDEISAADIGTIRSLARVMRNLRER